MMGILRYGWVAWRSISGYVRNLIAGIRRPIWQNCGSSWLMLSSRRSVLAVPIIII